MPDITDHDLLIRLDQKVENLTQTLNNHLVARSKQEKDFDDRLVAVENQMTFWKGSLAVVVVLFSTFAVYVLNALNK
jgi:hypothetical protein